MKRIMQGYTSLIKEALGIKNNGSFMNLPESLGRLILICGLIGLARNTLHVLLDTPIFYSFSPDILWTMFFWPIHLFLFPSAILHCLLYILGHSQITAKSIFSLSFYLQALHLLVPFIDSLGFALNLPWMYELGHAAKTTDFYSNFLVMSPGIIFVWLITAYMVGRVLHLHKIKWFSILTASMIAYALILIPIYFIWPSFNTLFNHIFGILIWDLNDPRIQIPRQIQWGYGSYMAITSILGYIYLHFQDRVSKQASMW